MTQESLLTAAARVIAGRVPGPFREQGGTPGDRAAFRFDTAARAYLWNRYVRKLPAARALEIAAPYVLRPYSVRPPQWFGKRGTVGAAWDRSGDSFRWFESTADSGLRFVAWADEILSLRYTGWHSRADGDGETLRGGVWQLPGRKGRARLVYGYAEFEGRGEMNPGSAAICVSDILETERAALWESVRDFPETRDAARYADGIAERQAEKARDYDSAYQAGREAAEADAEGIEARRELLPLLAELRAARKAGLAYRLPGQAPALCSALRARVSALLETVSEARAERDKLWQDCWSGQAEAWAAGFADNAEGGFVRAVRLGYRKATDWQGPADRNPCYAEAGA